MVPRQAHTVGQLRQRHLQLLPDHIATFIHVKHRDEFIPRAAAQEVGLRQTYFEELGKLDDDLVTQLMAVGVVDVLEVIQVNEEQRKAAVRLVPGILADPVLDEFGECRIVGACPEFCVNGADIKYRRGGLRTRW